MKKDKNIEKPFSNKKVDISEIEKKADNILKNRKKLEKTDSEKINVEDFSIKNKQGDSVFYVKASSKKKTNQDHEELSDKIISEARDNLGEEPLPIEEIEKQVDEVINKPKKKTGKLKIKLGKKREDEPLETETVEKPATKSEIFEEVPDKVENVPETKIEELPTLEPKVEIKQEETPSPELEKPEETILPPEPETKQEIPPLKIEPLEEKPLEETISQPEKKEPQIEEKTEETFEPKKTPEIIEHEEKPKITKKPKRLRFLKKKKLSDDKEIGDLVEKYDGKLIFSDTTSSETDFPQEDDDAKILDEKIASTSNQVDIDIPVDVGEAKAIELSKKHRFFGKKKKRSPKTKIPLGEKQEQDQEEKKPFNELKFRVENLPTEPDEDEAKLLDEKIRETPDETDTDENGNEVENKAVELAQEHIKDNPILTIEKETIVGKKDEKSSSESFDSFLEESEVKEEEHVFFDEADHRKTYVGWSPQTTDKKKTATPLAGQPEIDPDLKGIQDIELPKELLQSKSVKLSDLGFSENDWDELEFYPLHEPFAYVEVLRERESLDKCYFLVEIELTDSEKETMDFILETMTKLTIDTAELEETGDDNYLADRIDEILQAYDVKVSEESKHKLFYYIGKNSLGLGKIDPLLRDPNIEDISCDGSGVPIFLYHRKYGSVRSNIEFDDEEQLSSFIFKLAQKCGKHISIAEPMLDATMPDGSRVQMTLSDEITAKGSTFTIRKFREDPFSPPDLVEFNTMSSEMIAYMWIAVENGINTLFAGGTASGKTTALNALSLFIPRESKIVSIEETREINLPHPNWIPGVARSGFGEVVADKMVGEIDMYDLMKAALRQRPEYIIVGEIRGKEAYVLFQAMATGHATYSTVHADSAQSLIHRLEGKPINIPRVMLQSLDIVSLHIITRVKNKRARRCKQIIEIIDIDPTTKEILTNEVFRWDPVEDKFIFSGKSYILERIRAEKDLTREEMTEEIKNRKLVIEWMNDSNIREFRDVTKVLSQYIENPGEVINQVEKKITIKNKSK